MSKRFILVVLLLSLTISNSQSLDEFTIGEKHDDEVFVHTNLFDLDGMIISNTTNDGSVSLISFSTLNDKKISKSDFSKFKNGVEEKYGIKFDAENEIISDNYRVLSANNHKFQIFVSYEDNNLKRISHISFKIVDENLHNIRKKEKVEKTTYSNSISLKGVTLGEKLEGERIINTSVAGISGVIVADTINDGRIYRLSFIPTDENGNISRVYSDDVERLKTGVEKNYGIKLKTKYKEYGDKIESYYSSDLTFLIQLDYNKFMDIPYKIVLMLTDKELNGINKKEEQKRANTDF